MRLGVISLTKFFLEKNLNRMYRMRAQEFIKRQDPTFIKNYCDKTQFGRMRNDNYLRKMRSFLCHQVYQLTLQNSIESLIMGLPFGSLKR